VENQVGRENSPFVYGLGAFGLTSTAQALAGILLPISILVFLALSFACAGFGLLIGVISPSSRVGFLTDNTGWC
jgi:hypothetical protein